MSGSTGANLPVRIEVQGTQQAEAQFNKVGQAGAAAMGRVQRATTDAGASTGRFGQIVGQAGFQIGDFASQVQAGGSALTALSQQGSQLLGVFGVGGAIAGAALTVGILAAQLLGMGKAGDDAGKQAEAAARDVTESQNALATAVRAVNDLFLTQEERARNAARAQVEETRGTLTRQRDLAQASVAGGGFERDRAVAEAERFERLLAAERERNERIRRGGGAAPVDAEAELERRAREARARAEQAIVAQGEARSRLAEAEEALARLGRAGSDLGHGQKGPPVPPGFGRAERVAMGVEDVQGALAARTEELTRQFDAYNQALNLSTAGLERAAPALQAYAREQELLTQLLNANVISEEEFTAEVERSSIALQDQIRVAEQRAERASGAANQLGFSFSSAFEDAIVEGKALSDVLKGLEQDIARIIIRSAVTQPLGNAISGAVSAGIGGMFSTPAGPVDGMRATGGPVFPGGTYLVGERGPELLTMGAAGHVTPNAGGPSISQTFNIDARGADASMVPRLRAEMVAVARAANAELLAEIQRGGRAASIVGRR